MVHCYQILVLMHSGLPNVAIPCIQMTAVLGSLVYLYHVLSWQQRLRVMPYVELSFLVEQQVIIISLHMKVEKYIVWKFLGGSFQSFTLTMDIWCIQTITSIPICKPLNMSLMSLSPHAFAILGQIGC